MFSYYGGAMVRHPRSYGTVPTPSGFKSALISGFNAAKNARHHPCRPHVNWICNKDGNVVVDYIARFENFEQEYHYLVNRFGITNYDYSHVNKSKASELDYHDFYDNELVELVATKHNEDIKLFGYEY
jgi:hypothetical protein